MEERILQLLAEKLKPAIGCTEPIAIALAGGIAKKNSLGGAVEKIKVAASGNIIKNAQAVIIPGTGEAGIDLALSLGVVLFKNADQGLEILKEVKESDIKAAKRLIDEGLVEVELKDTDKTLYIEVILTTEKDKVKVVIEDEHTNVSLIEVDGKVIFTKEDKGRKEEGSTELSWLTIDSIYDFITEVDILKLGIIRESIRLNSNISLEGLNKGYGLEVGPTIRRNIDSGLLDEGLANLAAMKTAAASDARMSGVVMPVMSNTGSGNQGITATVPVLAVAEKLGADEDKILRAVALSHLITIYIKARFGVLSALCGATVAGTGASCGIVYLLGGGREDLDRVVNNMLGNVAGMLCDGAKPGCALKVATCATSAVNSALLALGDKKIEGNEGIVGNTLEETVDNFCRLSKETSNTIDKSILDIMVGKN